jgi:hypothetical protein
MVKVTDVTERKRQQNEHVRKVKDLAQKFFEGCEIRIGSVCNVRVEDSEDSSSVADIFVLANKIVLQNRKYLDNAKNFAHEYERSLRTTSKEVVVEQNYSESQ